MVTASEVWLRQGSEEVGLWTLWPARWSNRRGIPKLPDNWSVYCHELAEASLRGRTAAGLGTVFYKTFSLGVDGDQFIAFWRGAEEGPRLCVDNANVS